MKHSADVQQYFIDVGTRYEIKCIFFKTLEDISKQVVPSRNLILSGPQTNFVPFTYLISLRNVASKKRRKFT